MSGRGYLSIGDVLTVLREEFPDVTISKIRFLESQGLVEPERSPSGYRKFYPRDVERLRWVLRQQREHFLPLKVIRDRLERDGDPTPAGPTPAPATTPADDAAVTSPDDAAVTSPPGGAIHGDEGERAEPAAEPALAMSGAAMTSRPESAAPGASSGMAATGLGPLSAPRSAGAGPRGHDNGGSGRAAARTPPRTGGADRPGALGGRTTSAAAARAFQELRAAAGAGTSGPDAPARDEPAASRPEDASVVAGIGAAGGADATDATDGAGGSGGPEGAMASTGTGAPAERAQLLGAPLPGTAEDVQAAPVYGTGSTGTGGTDAGAGAARGPAEADPAGGDRPDGPAGSGGSGGRTVGDDAGAGPGAPGGGTGDDAGSGGSGGTRSGGRSSRGSGRSSATGSGPAGRPPSLGSLATGASLSADELCAASGSSAAELAALERFGLLHSVLVAGMPCYDEDALTVARLAAQLAQFGVEPRHLRLFRNAVDRELGLAEQVITPLLRQRNPEARQRAMDTAAELARLGEALRGALLREGLQGFFGRPG